MNGWEVNTLTPNQKTYRAACDKYHTKPNKWFDINIDENELVLKEHGIGPAGTKACAMALIVSFKHWYKIHYSTKIFTVQSKLNVCKLKFERFKPHTKFQVNRNVRKLDYEGNGAGIEGTTYMSDMLTENIYITDLVRNYL